MKASPLVALTSAIILIGCAGYGRPETPIAVECLDGNYIRLASCTLEQLAQRQGRLNLRDTREQHIVRIAHTNGIETRFDGQTLTLRCRFKKGGRGNPDVDPN